MDCGDRVMDTESVGRMPGATNLFIIVQIPFADLRPLVAGERGRLLSPDWAADEPKGFVRGFGKISPRNSSGLGLVGESRFADMGNAIRFPEHIDY
jgi:hypothetical protein